ncbi:MAG: FtsX-like permease family protein [Actinomycetales bacterium]|nr:FtsX-like permease family protein [Actinomycetales bacterium]
MSTAILGTAQTSSGAIAERFQKSEGNRIAVSVPASAGFEPTVERQVRTLDDVEQVGPFCSVTSGLVQYVEVRDFWSKASIGEAKLIVATTSGLLAHGIAVQAGVVPSEAAWQSDSSLALAGAAAARDLNLTTYPTKLRVDGRAISIVGEIIDANETLVAAQALIISAPTAQDLGIRCADSQFVVRTRPGRAPDVATALPNIIAPNAPEQVGVSLPPRAEGLKSDISSSVKTLILTITLITLIGSTVGVAGTMMAAVSSRRSEIGIQLAMGATRGWIARQFLAESAFLGSVGGLLGWALGVAYAFLWSIREGQEFLIPTIIWALPVAGVLAGLLGGIAPAMKATRVDPASLLSG